MKDETSPSNTTLDEGPNNVVLNRAASQILLAVAAMHDRAARHCRRNGMRRLMHEEAALYLRSISDDPEAIAALIAGIDKTESTAG